MTVVIDNRQMKVVITENLEHLIEKVISTTLELEKVDHQVEVSVVLVDNEQIRELNNEYRQIDRETDVLSFPMLEYDGYTEDDSFDYDEIIQEIDPDTQEIVLGDIVISLEKAVEQAEEYGHPLKREVGFLTVHGMLHLLGYDHMEDGDERLMRQRQEEVLKALELSRGTIE